MQRYGKAYDRTAGRSWNDFHGAPDLPCAFLHSDQSHAASRRFPGRFSAEESEAVVDDLEEDACSVDAQFHVNRTGLSRVAHGIGDGFLHDSEEGRLDGS